MSGKTYGVGFANRTNCFVGICNDHAGLPYDNYTFTVPCPSNNNIHIHKILSFVYIIS